MMRVLNGQVRRNLTDSGWDHGGARAYGKLVLWQP